MTNPDPLVQFIWDTRELLIMSCSLDNPCYDPLDRALDIIEAALSAKPPTYPEDVGDLCRSSGVSAQRFATEQAMRKALEG